jgi:tetratricopeptide (TPR) repeat protein
MNFRTVTTLAALAAGGLWLTTGCSRASIEAIELSNQGDQAVKVNVDGAIQKYEQAIQLDPTNHVIMYKLSKAHEKREDWDKLASTLARATQVAPEFANYYFKRGYALVKKAELDGNNKDAYEEAKEPLNACIQKDPHLAECYNLLGQAHLWTGDAQSAIDNFTKAIEHNPSVPFFYADLALTYLEFKLYKEADQVLKEGTRLIAPTDKNKDNLYTMYSMLAGAAQGLGDKAGQVVALEKAEELAGETHPEITYNLGSTYAVADPPQKEKALAKLNAFQKRACRSANATKFKDQCESAQALIQKLGGT